jgi:ferredoxin
MEPEATDRDDEIKWDLLQSELAVPESDTSPTPQEVSSDVRLPVEPTPASEASEPSESIATRNELLTFFYYGHRDENAGSAGEAPAAKPAARPVPALLYEYGDLSKVRHEYPICLFTHGPNAPGRTLMEVFNDLIEAESDDSDVGRRFRQHALRLEVAVRSLTSGVATPGRLSDLCVKAADELLESAGMPEERAAKFREDLDKARQALPVDGDVISCTPDAPARMLEAAMGAFWSERASQYLEQLDKLVRETENILTAADSRSQDAQSAEQLAEATPGENELDFDAMSDILGESHLSEPLPEERRQRIGDALKTIRRVRPLFASATGTAEPGEPPFPLETVVNDCPAAEKQHVARMLVMCEFFKCVRIARLEVDNKYHEEAHDPFFSHFDESELTDEELSYCPPVLMRLDSTFINKARKIELLNLLTAGTPVKVLVQLDDLCYIGKNGNASVAPAWTSQIAAMVAAMGNVYVSQSAVSRPTFVNAALMDGLRYNGPALFSVYSPPAASDPDLDTYLLAAAAEESRTFPSFTYDPGKGATLLNRVNVRENPQNERVWPTGTFVYQTETEERRTLDLPFTPVDFLLADSRFDDLFWEVPPSKWHPWMVPLSEYLQPAEPVEDDDDAEPRIPYVTAVNADNMVARIVLTRQVLTAVDRAAQTWRSLQEMGGIDNSHALALIADEKQRLADEKQREIEEIEKKYSAELERDLGELSEEIIRRIAGQLIAQGQAAPTFSAFPSTPAAPAGAPSLPAAQEAATPAPAGVEEAEEEEEAVTFDDPYIDTPLCTSCNDCMKINAQVFLYNENKQAYIGDTSTATFEQLVTAAEKCPVHIIHPGKPKNPNEPNLDALVARAAKFN